MGHYTIGRPSTGRTWVYLGETPPPGVSVAPSALWCFDNTAGELTDRVGANDLTLAAGTERHEVVNGLQALNIGSADRYSTAGAGLVALAALTVELQCMIRDTDSTTATMLFSHGTSGTTESTNVVYGLGNLRPQSTFFSFHEHGAGTDSQVNTEYGPGNNELKILTYVRAANGTACSTYANGVLVTSWNHGNAPTGGGSGVFKLGNPGWGGVVGGCILACARVWVGTAFTAEQALAAYRGHYK